MEAASATPHVVLWHILISHYSEKARWALEYKSVEHERRAPVPGLHMPLALWLTRGRHYTRPVMQLDGERIGDSTAIIAALERRVPEPPLYPADPAERRRALELEDWFDEQLGPYIRRLGFHELREDPKRFDAIAERAAPPALARLGRAGGVAGRAFVGLRYNARRREEADRAREKVFEALDHLEAELGDREYLAGDRFSVADLTAAALFYPLVRPPEASVSSYVEGMPLPFERLRPELSDRPGYRWVAETYRRHRRTGGDRSGGPDGATTPAQDESLSGSR
jgi:glutathione S-transferase